MNSPAKIIVERIDTKVSVRFANATVRVSEDTAQVLGRAMQSVAYGERSKVTVYEETDHRPAGLYSDKL